MGILVKKDPLNNLPIKIFAADKHQNFRMIAPILTSAIPCIDVIIEEAK